MKKNILIITGIYPPDIGGPATFAKELMKFINIKKDKVKLITLQDQNNLKFNEKNIIKLPRYQNKFLRTLNLIFTIRKNSKNIDSILCCGLILETYLSQIGLKNKKIFRFVGDSIWDKYLSDSKDIYYRKKNNYLLDLLFYFRNQILKSFNIIITPSDHLKRYYEEKIDKRDIKVIRNFASIESIYINKKENFKKYENKINLVVISRFVKQKNIFNLIESFKELSEFNLHLYGSGPEENNYKNLIKRNKSKNIFIHGLKKREEIFQALVNFDGYINISSNEGMSFSVLEALALHKPLILSNIQPNIETAKTASIYVDPESIIKIREAIKLLKSEKMRSVLSDNSKKINSTYYDKEKSLNLYYDEL